MHRPSDHFLVRIAFLPLAISIGFGILCGYFPFACNLSIAGVIAGLAMALTGFAYWLWCKRRGFSTRGAKYLVYAGAAPVALIALTIAMVVGIR